MYALGFPRPVAGSPTAQAPAKPNTPSGTWSSPGGEWQVGHLPDGDQDADAQDVGCKEQACEQRQPDQPAPVDGPSFEPGGGQQEQRACPQALDAAAGQVDLRDTILEDEDRVGADTGDAHGLETVATIPAAARRMG